MNHDEREPLEALNQLAPSARYLHRRRWSHAEAGMLLAGLRCELVWLAYAKFLGDTESERLLIAWVYQHAAGLADAEGWKIERGVPRIRRLAEITVWTFLRGEAWHSERALAAMFGTHHTTWGRTWARRYRALRQVLTTVENELADRLRERLDGRSHV